MKLLNTVNDLIWLAIGLITTYLLMLITAIAIREIVI